MIQNVRGTQDYFPEQMAIFQAIVQEAKSQAHLYGFQEIATPILEFREIFNRSSGETSDLISKEMYEIVPRSEGAPGAEDSVVLRPEGTAGIVRAILSNGLTHKFPLKFFYQGPMFRYDRPQKGRFRQFHQIGMEFCGESSPWADVEIMACAYSFLKALGLGDGKLRFEINTLGDSESRLAYREALIRYFQSFEKKLSSISQERLYKNPLRIFDSKIPQDQVISQNAPLFSEYLNPQAISFFQKVQDGLQALDISYQVNERLVRGLDYYEHTVFEWTTSQLGAQGTILAGGRYDGLMPLLGGPVMPSTGWAAGIERLMLLTQKLKRDPYLIGIIVDHESYIWVGMQIADHLRRNNLPTLFLGSGSLRKKLKKANQLSLPWVGILGKNEHNSQKISIKNLETGNQEEVPFEQVCDFFLNKLAD